MKSIGTIRRLDELGRIVIPKEIRSALRLRSGENLEIIKDDDKIILKKFSVVNNIVDLAQELTDAIYTFVKHNIIITDMHKIIACSGKMKKTLLNKDISDTLIDKIEKRETMFEKYKKELQVTDSLEYECSFLTKTMLKDGLPIGLILIFSEEESLTVDNLNIVEVVSSFITRYLEE